MSFVKDLVSFINGFRKWTIMASLILISATFRVLGYLSGAEMTELLKHTTIAFMATNGVEHMTQVVKEWLSKKV